MSAIKKGTTTSFNGFSLPPFDSIDLNTSSNNVNNSTDIVDTNPLTMEEFYALSLQDRMQYQSYYSSLLEKSNELEKVQQLKAKNLLMRASNKKERFHWINFVSRHCMESCVGERTLPQMWSEWISEEYNPLPKNQRDSVSMRPWTKDRIMRNLNSAITFQKDDVAFQNEAPHSFDAYDRIYYNEEQCIKKCIKSMEKSRQVLSEFWKKQGGWDEMHLRVMEAEDKPKPSQLFSPNSGDLLKSLIKVKKSEV